MFFKMSTVSSDWSRTMEQIPRKKKNILLTLNLLLANKKEKVTHSTQKQIHITRSLISFEGSRFLLWSHNTFRDDQITHIEHPLTSFWSQKDACDKQLACYSLRQNQELSLEAKPGGVKVKYRVAWFSCGRTRCKRTSPRVPHACTTRVYHTNLFLSNYKINLLSWLSMFSLPEDDTSSVVSVCGSEIMGYTFTRWRNDRYKTRKKSSPKEKKMV